MMAVLNSLAILLMVPFVVMSLFGALSLLIVTVVKVARLVNRHLERF